MNKFNRRKMIKTTLSSAMGVSSIASLTIPSTALANKKKPKTNIVVVGGGFGGTTCAKYLKRFSKGEYDVTLIEPKKEYITCPGSNWYLAGLVDIKTITHNYDSLKKIHGVKVIHDTVTEVNAPKKSIVLKSGKNLSYDRLVMSPGIDFNYDLIEGYSEKDINTIPHAYQAGPQTELLYKQLREMKDGGTFIMVAPPNPFRCPPGPYERVSMIAEYFKKHKPNSRIMIFDAKDKFSKQGLFTEGWDELYGNMIEWIPKSSGGLVTRVNVAAISVHTDFYDEKADVLNIIPAQKAANLAFKAGLTDESGWCPINQHTFESSIHSSIHVIGDASISGTMPKSGHPSSSQAKMCAAAIVSLEKGWSMPSTKNVNTCYSLVGDSYGISVAAVYEMRNGQIKPVEGAGGVSPKEASPAFRSQEALYARGWYKSITSDIWHS